MKEIWPGVRIPDAFAQDLGIVDGEFREISLLSEPASLAVNPSRFADYTPDEIKELIQGSYFDVFYPNKSKKPLNRSKRYSAAKVGIRSGQALIAITSATITAEVSTLPAAADGCQYILGFKALHDLIPGEIGGCLDNQAFAANGDAIQHTWGKVVGDPTDPGARADGALHGGILVWRKADNWTAFTNGFLSWVNGPYGIQVRLNSQRFSWEPNPDKLDIADLNNPIPLDVGGGPAPLLPSPTPKVEVTPAPTLSPEHKAVRNISGDQAIDKLDYSKVISNRSVISGALHNSLIVAIDPVQLKLSDFEDKFLDTLGIPRAELLKIFRSMSTPAGAIYKTRYVAYDNTGGIWGTAFFDGGIGYHPSLMNKTIPGWNDKQTIGIVASVGDKESFTLDMYDIMVGLHYNPAFAASRAEKVGEYKIGVDYQWNGHLIMPDDDAQYLSGQFKDAAYKM